MSTAPWLFSRGLRAPRQANVWPTACTASSTVRERTRLPLGDQRPGPIAVGEEQEKREFVGECGEEGVESQAATEVRPEVPCGPLGGGALTSDAGMCRCLDSAPITAESIPLVGGNMRQDALCGYEVLKWVSRAVSDNCQRRLASSAMVLSGPGM
jgi:hypothetical protein